KLSNCILGLLEPTFPETRLRSLGSLIRRHFPLAALFSAALEVKRPQKIDCGFPQSITTWACYLVFKDRAACFASRPLLPSTSLPVSFQPAGLQLLFQFAVSVNFAFASCGLLRISSAPSSDFRRFFSKGSGFYFSAAFPVNRLLSAFLTALRPSCCLPDCCFFGGARLLSLRRVRCQLAR
ncbi:hypothetical protein, partial [Corallococcus sp. CA049B]|uniref:hypothetical protein n=1 Tax=Corallococcus sp. CA049B TaxID=2316730 RepID=UPI001F1D5BEE